MTIERLLSFLQLTLRFRDIYRTIKIPGKVSTENDAEHSYQLAMFAWYINEADALGLDSNKIVRLALVHDFAEVYAGDVDTHTDDLEALRIKPAREEAAREQLKRELPEFVAFHEAMIEYEKRESEEAKLVYAADKMIAELNVYLDNERINIEKGLTIERIRKNKDPKIAISPVMEKYWLEFIPLWEKNYRTERK